MRLCGCISAYARALILAGTTLNECVAVPYASSWRAALRSRQPLPDLSFAGSRV